MAEEKKNKFTRAGFEELQEELSERKTTIKAEIGKRIEEARAQGDLSENAEYDAAKDEQRDIEARIEEIEKILKNAEVFDEDESEAGTVNFGAKVVLHDMDMDEIVEYKIVGSTEANFLKGKISNESPLGAAIMRKKIGDVVTIEAPEGEFKYKILDIRKK